DATKRLSRTLRHNESFDSSLFAAQVKQKIDCLNVAGLCDRRNRNWYEVDLDDVIARAEKLEITPDEMRRFLLTASWAQTAVNLRQRGLKQPPQSIRSGVYQDRLADEYEPVGELVGASPAYRRVVRDALTGAPPATTLPSQ